MSDTSGPRRLIHSQFDLEDVINELGRDAGLVERDFALMTIAAQFVRDYGDELCFKGGFVLRHVHGHERFSKDIDATRTNPPKHKLDADDVANSMRQASMRNLIQIEPGAAATDTARSLDFDEVTYTGPLGRGVVSVEVSYREAVIKPPVLASIGLPYYDSFEAPVMALEEIVAEKMRTLCQRQRPTDLSDLAMIFSVHGAALANAEITELAAEKFKQVKAGDRLARIEQNVEGMATSYDAAVSAVAPDAPSYNDALEIVLPRITPLLP